jgi:glycosyltransferase involved in cell wall biosynthesis
MFEIEVSLLFRNAEVSMETSKPNSSSLNSEMLPALGLIRRVPKQEELATQSTNLQEILNRLDYCTDLVESELANYMQAPTGENPSPRTDYLLSIVIPVYNEINTVSRVISRVAALPLNKELVIVDDCSTDGTREVLKNLEGLPGIQIILKDKNAGKGAALRTGFENFTGDFVIVQDADLEYDPCDIPQLIQPLLRDEADVVYGSRFLGDELQDESWIHRAGNAILTGASNLFSGLNLTDMETCYKAFNRDVIKAINVEQERFGIEPEITAKLARLGYRFVEVPISYDSRGYDEGKKIGIKDLFNAIYCIGRYGIAD